MSALHPFSLQNKNILITGASSGIGRVIAIESAKLGAKVILTGRNTERLNDTFENLSGKGHKMIVADLNDGKQRDALIQDLPPLDGLVMNAGINKRQLTQYLKSENVELIVNTNLVSPLLLTKDLLKSKKIASEASVVFISSIAAFHSSIGDGVYSATKGAVASYAKVLALELAPRRIRVNTIQPGMVHTALTENGPLSDDDYKKDEQKYPLGRYGRPEDVAFAAIYLLSDASAWMTGTDIKIDGGISLV